MSGSAPRASGASAAPAMRPDAASASPRRWRWWALALLGIMGCVAFTTIYPVFFTLNAALKSHPSWIEDRFAISIPPSFDAFREAWRRSSVPQSFLNSVIVTAGGVIGAWIVCIPAAFAATKLRFRGRNALFLFLLASMMIPTQTILYPFFVLMRDLRWINTYHGLILAYVTFAVPITMYQLAAYFKRIPNDLLDAARLDGASAVRLLLTVVVPLSRPVLATTGIINCIWMWNDLLLPLMVMQRPDRQTLTVSLGLLRGQYGAEPTLIAAGVVIGIAPIFVVFLIAQEYLIKGMTQGAVK
jgi:ABC-type glycerol-3-phosphate transport system permease component